VNLNFNSYVFQRTEGFPLGQRASHSTFPSHHRLWDTTQCLDVKQTVHILGTVIFKCVI